MDLVWALVIGFVGSTIGSFVSGGLSLVTLPALLFLGLPPHTALGTMLFGVLGFDLGGIFQYAKNKKVVWKAVPLLTIFSTTGMVLGGLFLFQIDEELLTKIIGVAIIILIPILLIKRDLGVVEVKVSPKRRVIGFLSTSVISFYGAIAGVGYGFFAVMSNIYFFGWRLIEAKATGKLPGMVATAFTLAIFIYNGAVDWSLGISLIIGMFFGSLVATHYAIKVGDRNLKIIVLLSSGLMAVKFLFFS